MKKKKTLLQVFLLACMGFLWLSASSQDARAQHKYAALTAKVNFEPATSNAAALLETVQKQTTYVFTFERSDLQKVSLQELRFRHVTLGDVLHYLETQEGLLFYVNNKNIAVSRNADFKKPLNLKKATGKITGKIIDGENGQPIAGATFRVGNKGTTTDISGSFTISLPAGNYTAIISYLGYGTKELSDVMVKENETATLNATLTWKKGNLAEVEIRASAGKEGVASLYARQKNNAGITDGISAEQIARTPDKNIGETLKRISGLSTMDNKYVTVRGLSERYNGAALNGQLLPSTELNRKQFSFDIIPANMVDNVIVSKTITPDMNAEFGGGLVQVNTKDIPTENFLAITVGGSYNDKTTGKEFKSLPLEGRQYFGQVPETRYLLGQLNWKSREQILTSGNFEGANLKDPGKFVNNWMPHNYKAGFSPNLQLSLGKVANLKNDRKIGMIVSGSFRNTWQTQEVHMSRDGYTGTNDHKYGFLGNRYGFTSNIAGLAAMGYSDRKMKLGFQTLYQLGYDQQLLLGSGINGRRGDNGTDGYYDITRQTALWQNQLKGEHGIGQKGIKLNWMLAYTSLNRQNPDNHFMQFTGVNKGKDNQYQTTDFSITEAISYGITRGVLRSWSRATERNFSWNQDLSVPFRFTAGQLDVNNILKAGYAGWTKNRTFWVLNTGTLYPDGAKWPQPISEAYDPLINNKILVEAGGFGDDFNRNASLHAVYGMLDNRFGKKFRLVWGLRAEYYNMNKANPIIDRFMKDHSNNGSNIDYSVLLKKEPNLNLFPSANLTYSLTPAMNIRLAYSKSIVRPDLREMAYFQQYDFELDGNYSSMSPILSSRINNYDFRYEWYPGPGEVLAVSLFYKKIKYPMEIYKEGDNRSYFLRNNASATNKGIEVEVRKSFAFTGVPILKNITVAGNFTRLYASVVPMTIQYTFRQNPGYTKMEMEEKKGAPENRPQTGASNYIGNAAIYYDTKPFSLSLNYNYVSNRTFRTADKYQLGLFERPLNALDAQCVVRLLKQKAEIKLNVGNLLNTSSLVYKNSYNYDYNKQTPTTRELQYDKGSDEIDYEACPGRTYSIGFSYKF